MEQGDQQLGEDDQRYNEPDRGIGIEAQAVAEGREDEKFWLVQPFQEKEKAEKEKAGREIGFQPPAAQKNMPGAKRQKEHGKQAAALSPQRLAGKVRGRHAEQPDDELRQADHPDLQAEYSNKGHH